MRALLLIDIQNDFLPGGALSVPGGDEVVSVVNRLMHEHELVIATQDWHPADHLSFASQHPGRQVGDVIQLEGLALTLRRIWIAHGFTMSFRKGPIAASIAIAASSTTRVGKARAWRSICDRDQSTQYTSSDWQPTIAIRRAARIDSAKDLGLFGNGIEAASSVVTAIACFGLTPDSYEQTIGNAILLGGDTDTIAPMAGAV